MSDYLRPPLEARVFTDETGAVIPYGRRWAESPPAGSYSVSSNLERFAPLHTIADALVAHLAATYDVAVAENPEAAARFDIARAVRVVELAPRAAGAAPLRIVYTALPGIVLDAGALHREVLPVCGCDACDEDWPRLAEDLEQIVLAVAEGRFSEGIADGTARFRWDSRDGLGASSGMSVLSERDTATIEERGLRLPWTGEWRAWPIRTARTEP